MNSDTSVDNLKEKNKFTAFGFTFTYETIKTECIMNYITITFYNCVLVTSTNSCLVRSLNGTLLTPEEGRFYKSIVLDDCFVRNICFN